MAVKKSPSPSPARLHFFVIALVIMLVSLVVWLSFSSEKPLFDRDRAYAHVKDIVSFGPRPSGSETLGKVRALLRTSMEQGGIRVSEDSFPAATPEGTVQMTNVTGVIDGRSPSILIIAAHYESKRFKGCSFVGANDNASGTGILLELARVIPLKKLDSTIWLLFLDGEEAFENWSPQDSLYGSRHCAARLVKEGAVPLVRAFILLDMLGDKTFLVNQDIHSTPWLRKLMLATAQELQLGASFSGPAIPVDDDHIPFLQAGIPSLDIIDFNYPYWHTPEDTLDKISAESLGMAGRVVERMLEKLDTMNRKGRGL